MMMSFMERAARLEDPKDLEAARGQLKVLKAIVGHLENQLNDALGVPGPKDRVRARQLLNAAFAAQRALAELNHAPALLSRNGAHPFPEAAAQANKRAIETDEAFMNTFFPVPEGAVQELNDETSS